MMSYVVIVLFQHGGRLTVHEVDVGNLRAGEAACRLLSELPGFHGAKVIPRA